MKSLNELLTSPRLYLGKVCRHGHDHSGSGQSVRIKANATCYECQALRIQRWGKTKGVESIKKTKKKHRASSNRDSEYKKENAEKIREYNKKYIAANKAWHASYYRQYNANKKARIIKATPQWANKEAIINIYKQCQGMESSTGKFHVDHIVPLISKFVCGLHVEQNLRILPAIDNLKKGNRWWPNSWDEEIIADRLALFNKAQEVLA